MNISVFGDCYCSDDEYNKIYEFAKNKLKGKDIKIINCATIGTVEAISKGAKENNVETIGASLDKWVKYINEYVDELHIFNNEMDRMKYVYDNSDMFLIFDGDLGTKEELFIVLQITENLDKKIYVLGEKIKEFLEYCFKNRHLSEEYKKYIIYSNYNEFNI